MSENEQNFVKEKISDLGIAVKNKDKRIIEEHLRQQYYRDNNIEYLPNQDRRQNKSKQQDKQKRQFRQQGNQTQQQKKQNQQQQNQHQQDSDDEYEEEYNFSKLYSQHIQQRPNQSQRNNKKYQYGVQNHYKKNRNTKRTEKHIKSNWPEYQNKFGSNKKEQKFIYYKFNNFDDDYHRMNNKNQNPFNNSQFQNYNNDYQQDRRDRNREFENNNNQKNRQQQFQYNNNKNNNNNNQNNNNNINMNNNNNNNKNNQNHKQKSNRDDKYQQQNQQNNQQNRNKRNQDDQFNNNRNNNYRQNNKNYKKQYSDEFGLDQYEEYDKQDFKDKRDYKRQNQKNNRWKDKKTRNIYEQYYSQEEIEKGKKENKIFEGIFLANEFVFRIGNVKCPIFSRKVQINESSDINRALHGSLVAFKIIKAIKLEEESEATEEEIQIKLPEIKQEIIENKEIVLEDDHDEDWVDMNSDEEESESEEVEEEVYVVKKQQPLTTIQQLQKSKLVGKIVAVLKNPYENRQMIGKIELREVGGNREYRGNSKEEFLKFIQQNFYLSFKSVNKRLPYFNMKQLELFNFELTEDDPVEKYRKYLSERYFAVKYLGWKQNEKYPLVELIKEVGIIGNIEIECEMILNENLVYDNDFSDQCKEELKKFTHDSIAQEKEKRLDLTKEYICSIDPVTARDLDDALSIQKVEDGIYEIGVHIADVSHFVRINTEIDKEATLRTTSVYLVHKVIPMLPRMLCEELCSLNRDVERLAFSVFFKMTEEGDVIWNSFRASKSVMRSCAQLSYDIVNQMINGEIQQFSQGEARYAVADGFDENVLKEKILLLNSIAQKRRQKRLEGSLTIEKGKLRFILDQKLNPIGFQEEKRGLAQFMVEEWMLLANQFVGKKLIEYDRKTAVLRQHIAPKYEKIRYYKQLLEACGLQEISNNLDVSTSKKLKETLDIINNIQNEEIKTVLGFRLLRLMEAANYFVVDTAPEDEWRHYALDFDVYTHFTSPIRRYPDILAHRRLQIALENQEVDQSGETRDKLKAVLEKCNECRLNARRVSDSCDHLFLALYLRANPVIVDAFILSISQQQFEVIIPQYNLERKIDLKSYDTKNKIIIENINSKKYITQKEQQIQQNKEEEEKEKKNYQIIIIYDDPKDDKGQRLYFIEQFQKVKIRLSGTETFPIEYKIQFIINDDLLI